MKYAKLYALSFGLFVDAILAAVLAYFFRADISGTVLIFLGLLFLPAIVAAWSGIKAWIWFHLWQKEAVTRIVKAQLTKSKMPDTSEFFDVENYLEWCCINSDFPVEVRMKAANIAGEITGTASVSVSQSIMLRIAIENAMSQYAPPVKYRSGNGEEI